MKFLRTLVQFLVLYVVFLIWRFPYQTLVERTMAYTEAATGARFTYTPGSTSIFGVEMKELTVQMPSGARLTATEASLHPGFSGLSAHLSQALGYADASVSSTRQLTLKMEKFEVETGSQELGKTRVTGVLNYNLGTHEGNGDVGLQVPRFQAPLPIPEMALDIGTKLTIVNKTPGQPALGSQVKAEVHILGGTEFDANGNVLIESQPGAPPKLNGTLTFKTPMRRGTLRLEGTWQKPQWSIVSNT